MIRPLTILVTSGSGNGLVLSGNKSFPESMLNEIHAAILRHQATKFLIDHIFYTYPTCCYNCALQGFCGGCYV